MQNWCNLVSSFLKLLGEAMTSERQIVVEQCDSLKVRVISIMIFASLKFFKNVLLWRRRAALHANHMKSQDCKKLARHHKSHYDEIMNFGQSLSQRFNLWEIKTDKGILITEVELNSTPYVNVYLDLTGRNTKLCNHSRQYGFAKLQACVFRLLKNSNF